MSSGDIFVGLGRTVGRIFRRMPPAASSEGPSTSGAVRAVTDNISYRLPALLA
jgi:hypothetical protein